MSLALVWAQTPTGIIGRDGTLPWHVPEDMAHFRDLTRGHARPVLVLDTLLPLWACPATRWTTTDRRANSPSSTGSVSP